MTTDQSDIVERLLSNAVSWLRDDAMEGRIGEEEARLNDEAAAEIMRLRAANGWKQAVGIIEKQQEALDFIAGLLKQWSAEGRLPKDDEVLARQFHEVFERARSTGADYMRAMRQSGALK